MGKALVGWMLAAALAIGGGTGLGPLDTPTVIANPQADMATIHAWMAPDGQRLDLVMDIVGESYGTNLANWARRIIK